MVGGNTAALFRLAGCLVSSDQFGWEYVDGRREKNVVGGVSTAVYIDEIFSSLVAMGSSSTIDSQRLRFRPGLRSIHSGLIIRLFGF